MMDLIHRFYYRKLDNKMRILIILYLLLLLRNLLCVLTILNRDRQHEF